MEKIILEDRFTSHQKTHLLLFLGGPVLIIMFLSLHSWSYPKDYIIFGGCILVYTSLAIAAFFKRGFVKLNSKLYMGSFFFGVLFLRTRIDISKTPKLAVLHLRKTQKMAWFSMANPDLSSGFETYEINFLNKHHTKRNKILMLKKKENVDPTVAFLTSNFDLQHEQYRRMYRRK